MTAMKPSLTFALEGDAATITRRAAAMLRLPVVDLPDGTFRVELNEPYDAYRLADYTAADPGWARVFLNR